MPRTEPFEITPLTRLEDRIEALEALVETMRRTIHHINPQCIVCGSTMDRRGARWVCLINDSHPDLADWVSA